MEDPLRIEEQEMAVTLPSWIDGVIDQAISGPNWCDACDGIGTTKDGKTCEECGGDGGDSS